ncbi:MAG: translation initiation factor [Phycisphaerales bacterium]
MSRLFAGTQFEQPATCEPCGRVLGECVCPRHKGSGKVITPADQQLRIRREKRGGKFVTVVDGFAERSEKSNDLPTMLKSLKAKLATGGSCSPTSIEVQGDHRDRLVEHFKSLGYPAKPSGG